ncbi:MAG: hypothetical protein IPN13_17815 [Bacteroidetes bacterium]|nr:hypothetical protein [Bacteroidota bacterium]
MVTINLIPYKHIPSVHGFKFSNGYYFIAFATWDEKGIIRQPIQDVFINIYPSNQTKFASSMKNLFDNWLHQAAR